MESPTLPNAENTVTSSSDAKLKTEEVNLNEQNPFQTEAPLLGLCPKPMHLMSSEEKRNHLAKIRNMRTNFSSWRAGVGAESGEVVKEVENFTTGLEDLL